LYHHLCYILLLLWDFIIFPLFHDATRHDTSLYIFTSAIVNGLVWFTNFVCLWLWKYYVITCWSKPTMSDGQPGLLSSVFGYLSREVQDFVTTATGGSTSTTEVSVLQSNLPRLHRFLDILYFRSDPCCEVRLACSCKPETRIPKVQERTFQQR
jgi:hypothetical protein